MISMLRCIYLFLSVILITSYFVTPVMVKYIGYTILYNIIYNSLRIIILINKLFVWLFLYFWQIYCIILNFIVFFSLVIVRHQKLHFAQYVKFIWINLTHHYLLSYYILILFLFYRDVVNSMDKFLQIGFIKMVIMN